MAISSQNRQFHFPYYDIPSIHRNITGGELASYFSVKTFFSHLQRRDSSSRIQSCIYYCKTSVPSQKSALVKQLSACPAPMPYPLLLKQCPGIVLTVLSRGEWWQLEARGFPGNILPPSSAQRKQHKPDLKFHSLSHLSLCCIMYNMMIGKGYIQTTE